MYAAMVPGMEPPASADPVQSLLLRSGIAAMLLCALAAVTIRHTVPNTLIDYYFFHQDVWLLGGAGLMLCVLSNIDVGARPLRVTRGALAGAVITAAVLAYFGSYVVVDRYALSRDEVMADLAAGYFRHGLVGRPIPPGLRTIGSAMMPWADTAHGVWMSSYLPVGSLLRAAAWQIGDPFLAGPVLLIVGCGGLWVSARTIWPDRIESAVVALVLALTSTQLLANAMTAYAMTAHFALNALWLAFYLRRDARGHVVAIALGLLATGLHQVQFHILFVSGFIVWDFANGRRRTAWLYVGACVAYVIIWAGLYPHIVVRWAPHAAQVHGEPDLPFGTLLRKFAGRIGDLQPISSLGRFAAWQNILLLPLAVVGARGLRDADGRPTIMVAFAVSCAIGMLLMVYQGHGYGYRYLHGLIPCFCLLAAGGWVRLSAMRGRPMPSALLWVGCGFALAFTAPVALTLSHVFLHPYAAAYRVLRKAPADVVLVDGRGGAFIEDLVRIDGPISRPILLDLSFVTLRDLRRLCATSRVMIFDEVQARPLGIRPGGDAGKYERHLVMSRALLARLRCGRPVPIG